MKVCTYVLDQDGRPHSFTILTKDKVTTGDAAVARSQLMSDSTSTLYASYDVA